MQECLIKLQKHSKLDKRKFYKKIAKDIISIIGWSSNRTIRLAYIVRVSGILQNLHIFMFNTNKVISKYEGQLTLLTTLNWVLLK